MGSIAKKNRSPSELAGESVRASPGTIEDKHHSRAHAVCSSSSSKMWINCPPSARLQELFPDETSEYAERGTYVHELCEYKLKRTHKKRVKRPQSEEYDDEAAESSSDLYVEIITEAEEAMKRDRGEVVMLIEEKLDFSEWVPDGFGSGDCLLCSPNELHVFDYKNGYVFVDADHNSQMMLYALGAFAAYDFIFNFQTISMTIVQPNAENISTYTVSRDELLAWGEWLKPIAKMAFEGKGELKAGDHCRWCKAKPRCPARQAEAMALVNEEFLDLDAGEAVLGEAVPGDDGQSVEGSGSGDSSRGTNDGSTSGEKGNSGEGIETGDSTQGIDEDDAENDAENDAETDVTAPYNPDTETPVFRQPMLVSNKEIERILPTLNRISDWIESVFAYVASEAIHHGVKWEGYKVVEGRSRRIFTDTKAVVKAAQEAGYTDLYKQELLSLTEFEKMMGKKTFNTVLGNLVAKPPGKLSLVPESDPREAVDLEGDGPSEFDVME